MLSVDFGAEGHELLECFHSPKPLHDSFLFHRNGKCESSIRLSFHLLKYLVEVPFLMPQASQRKQETDAHHYDQAVILR